jgi:MFS transporter, FHS family, Na+ dependent glucose transporter 1
MKNSKIPVTLSYYAAFVALGISMSSLGPTLPGLAANTRATISAISVLFTARSLGSLVGSAGGGWIYDRLHGNRVMALMIVGMAALTALTPRVPLLWVLSGVLFLTGVVQGILNVGGNALLIWLHGREVGPFMNGLHFFYGIGTFITPVIIAQFVARQDGLWWTYILLAVIILPTAVMAFLPSPQSPLSVKNASNAPVNAGLVVLIALVFGCYSGASLAYGGWIFTYATEMKLTNSVNAAYLTSVFWGALTLGRLVAVPLAVRLKPQTILWSDFSGALVSLLVMLLWPRSLPAVVIASAGLGFSLASIYPTTMSLSGQLMTLSGKITGLFTIGSSAGAMLIPWIAGQFFESSGPRSLSIVLLMDMLLALVVLALLARQVPVQKKEPGVITNL